MHYFTIKLDVCILYMVVTQLIGDIILYQIFFSFEHMIQSHKFNL